ncbi:TPA: hypothetical protein O3860_002487 [Staphylococcus aureus]|uniref:hypothetical protein n=1 Tax=Staphylococcus aureus TaxID=1280 RepID=UPI000B9ACC4B|nr:hypothetical protein [Staphylococcus aureus]ELK7034908.1 hypothetical protein [Staphylococcus aureus]MBV2551808.1 hypothetical protein [Staphylococcus aureus]MBV2557175.1 hypothetical protein [Staphylococcus aureus]MBV2559353.1 hypothetical protein [Staphylococcus aureus]MBV2563503.1 hypothetical protein [Staphylococcus aureus]
MDYKVMLAICILSATFALGSLVVSFIVRKDLDFECDIFLYETTIIRDKIKEIEEKVKPLPMYVVKMRNEQYIKIINVDGAHLTIVSTGNVLEAKSYNSLSRARLSAEHVNGTVLKYKHNLEVVE